jgi:hypothetical protein
MPKSLFLLMLGPLTLTSSQGGPQDDSSYQGEFQNPPDEARPAESLGFEMTIAGSPGWGVAGGPWVGAVVAREEIYSRAPHGKLCL